MDRGVAFRWIPFWAGSFAKKLVCVLRCRQAPEEVEWADECRRAIGIVFLASKLQAQTLGDSDA